MRAIEQRMTTHIAPRPACPECKSQYVKRYGRNASGNQRYSCKRCGTQFVALPPAVKPTEKSGVIPVPCRGHEFRPLKRDPFALMRLAMVTRG